jgi:hypothetical protein
VLLAAVAYLAVFVLTVLGAYWALFGQFRPWDDEGVFEYGIRLVDQGHHLYSGFYSDYGPFSYELWGLLFKAAGRTISTDSGRLIQVGIWSFSCLCLGLASHRLTHRLAIGISVQALSFATLWVMDNEPMHPGGLIVLLLAVALCVVVFGLERWPRLCLFALGALVSAIALTKVNLGGFALIALAFATVMAHPSLRSRAWPRRLVTLAFVGVAPVLMYSNLGQDWVQRYAALAVGGTLALSLVAGAPGLTTDGPLLLPSARRFIGWLIGGMVVAAVVIVGVIVALGSTLSALILDIVIQPSDTGSVVQAEPVPLSSRVIIWALVAVGIAWGLRRSGALNLTNHISGLASGLLRLLVGLAIWLSVASMAPLSAAPDAAFALAMPLAWVAAVPTRARLANPQSYFMRVFVTALALLEGLTAYPVAGSQVWFGAALFLVCGAICVADGLADLESWQRERVGAGDRLDARQLLNACAIAVALVFVYNAEQNAASYRSTYTSGVPLSLRGASHVRLGTQQATTIEHVVALLKAHCRSLLSIPGRESFSEWTGLPTPVDLVIEENGPGAMTMADQRRALDTVEAMPGLCVLETNETGPGATTGMVVEYIAKHYRPISTTSGTSISGNYSYTVEVRKRAKHRSAAGSSARRRR